METNTLLLIGAGVLGGLLALLLLIKIMKGILQIGYLLLVLGASAFLAYYVGTPEGSNLLPRTVNLDVRLIQAGIIILFPLLMSLVIAILVFFVRRIFKSDSKRVFRDSSPTPVMPFHPPTQQELEQIQRTNPASQYPPPPSSSYSAPTIQNMPHVEETRPTPKRRNK